MKSYTDKLYAVKLYIFLSFLFCITAAAGMQAQEKSGSKQKMHKLISREVRYSDDKTEMKGYMVYDASVKGKRPGVIVVHEFWGLNDYAKKRADMLAELGYTAFAVDMYGGGTTANNPQDAQKLAGEVRDNMNGAVSRFNKAVEVLKAEPETDAGNIAAIGYCFGGGVVLNMARINPGLRAVVSFHGTLAPAAGKTAPKGMKPAVLVCHGGADHFITPEEFEDFRKEMEQANADYTIIVYANSQHAFTNPDADRLGKEFKMDISYNEKADKESWLHMQQFLTRIFKGSLSAQSMKEYIK
ncbi:MAG: dienelactone hydrolase family protein [Bacteroidota bacterium]